MRAIALIAATVLGACARLPAHVASEMTPAPRELNHYDNELDRHGSTLNRHDSSLQRTDLTRVVAYRGPTSTLQAAAEAGISAVATLAPQELLRAVRVADGQIVVSEQGGGDSLFVSLMTDEYQPFVHAGIVVLDDGEPYVYEQRAALRPYLWGPPTHSMGGQVRRVPLARFLARHRIVALYDPPAGTDGAEVARFARLQLARRAPFDPYFNLSDPNAMYCTEFVALALEAGGARIERVPISSNRSVGTVLAWLGIHTDRIITAGSLMRAARRVGLSSPGHTPAELEMYFELKRELHRRFTAEQKLGNALRWSWTGLKLREPVRRYLRAGLDAARAGPPATDTEREALVRSLALQFLGPPEELQNAGRAPVQIDRTHLPAPHTSLR